MLLLTQFLFRLSFGMAAAMAITPPKLVTSGYYRNNLYVLLGMNALAALVAWGITGDYATTPLDDSAGAIFVMVPRYAAAAAAVLSYFAAACWLYEKPRAGIALLAIISVVTLAGALATTPRAPNAYLGTLSSGLLLGTTMAAMLLGHWYLNAPGMRIQPLFRLTACMGGALVVRTVVSILALSIVGFASTSSGGGMFDSFENAQWFMLCLRWLAGILGTAGLIAMTWSTLKIPNTQAATGMLYVAVITTFLGELIGQLLSAGTLYSL